MSLLWAPTGAEAAHGPGQGGTLPGLGWGGVEVWLC